MADVFTIVLLGFTPFCPHPLGESQDAALKSLATQQKITQRRREARGTQRETSRFHAAGLRRLCDDDSKGFRLGDPADRAHLRTMVTVRYRSFIVKRNLQKISKLVKNVPLVSSIKMSPANLGLLLT